MSGHLFLCEEPPTLPLMALGILALWDSSALYKMLAHAVLNEESFETKESGEKVGDCGPTKPTGPIQKALDHRILWQGGCSWLEKLRSHQY